ncbi:hypothetical protein LA080_015986 [Diaporthe eres]|uniref:Extracellular membrane protein CFEM domain-containing protein n=1 Tax=Diaporthe vaccinii TaxID=105482 RepID=A0ABR4E067_9PEZI|nr:hypothetical protein LA080_015986 [Diaporthe eres]
MRLDTLPSTVILYVLLLTSPARAAVDVDFSAYPASAQSCLTQAVDTSGCSSQSTVSEMNDCLCGNSGDFVLDSARCLGSLGSAETMSKVYDTMQQSCSETKTPLSVSEAQWLAEGKKGDAVTSTVTTTIGTMVLTFSTTITPTPTSTSSYTTSTARAESDEDEDDNGSTDEDDEDLSLSAKIGVITSSIAGAMTLACIACMIIFFTKRKKDKQLLAEARAAAARAQDKHKDQNRSLLGPAAVTPGLPSPAGQGGVNGGYEAQVFGASVVPPTPAYPGPAEAQAWRGGGHGMADSPSELTGDSAVYQLYDGHPQRSPSAWPSPLTLPGRGFSQGLSRATTLRSESSWAPSPASAFASSNALGMYNHGPSGTSGSGPGSAISSPIARQGTNTSRSSWAHNRPHQEELYELPGMEARSPVEADSNPIMALPESTSDPNRISTPPEYSSGGWVDPNTDKPPL